MNHSKAMTPLLKLKNDMTQIIEATSAKQGNLYGTIRNQIRRKIHGGFVSIFFSPECGSVKRTFDGQFFDWFVDESGKLIVTLAE